jgi:hypothetical protein
MLQYAPLKFTAELVRTMAGKHGKQLQYGGFWRCTLKHMVDHQLLNRYWEAERYSMKCGSN